MAKFSENVTFFVSGKPFSSCPVILEIISLGKSVLVNGVETERKEMCVSWGAQPEVLYL